MSFLIYSIHAHSSFWNDIYGPTNPQISYTGQRYLSVEGPQITYKNVAIEDCQFYLISVTQAKHAPLFINQSQIYHTTLYRTSFYGNSNSWYGGSAFIGNVGGELIMKNVCGSFSTCAGQGTFLNINRQNQKRVVINYTSAFRCEGQTENVDSTISATHGVMTIANVNFSSNKAKFAPGIYIQELQGNCYCKYFNVANNTQYGDNGLVSQYQRYFEAKFYFSYSNLIDNVLTPNTKSAVISCNKPQEYQNPITFYISQCNMYNNQNAKYLILSEHQNSAFNLENIYSDITAYSMTVTRYYENSQQQQKIQLNFDLFSTENCVYILPTPFQTPQTTPLATTPYQTPSSTPSTTPSSTPSTTPSSTPSTTPSSTPSSTPENTPSSTPSSTPENTPSSTPSLTPENTPSSTPSLTPENTPSSTPSSTPENTPSSTPSLTPENTPSSTPSITPSTTPEITLSSTPSITPEFTPSSTPQTTPVDTPSTTPETTPIEALSSTPQTTPLTTPTETPSTTPNTTPSETPNETPSTTPQTAPTETPSSTPNPSEVEIPAVIPVATALQSVYPTPIISPNYTNNGAIFGESAVGVEDKGFQTIVQSKWFIIVIVGVIIILILALILAFIIFMIIPKNDDSSSYSESISKATDGELEELPEQMDSGETMEISSNDPESPTTSPTNEPENELSEEVDSGETMEVSDGDVEE